MAKKLLGKQLPPVSTDYVDPAPTQLEQEQLLELWDIYAPARYKGLLRAENKSVLEETQTKPSGRFIWDDKIKRYIEVRTGRILSMREVRSAASLFSEAYANR